MPTAHTCPNCQAAVMEVFYKADRIPVHSCMMLEHREQALAFPTRDLALGFCSGCGFVSNVLFDSSVQKYTAGYEEQQSFSPRFRDFQSEMIAGLIERYDLRGKDIVEIGCGKGDFLVELCEAGNNRGVGIDPACDPDRMSGRGGGRVRFVGELYSDRHADLPCDFLCCRHTLEHIHPTNDFIRLMREVVGNRSEMVVFFEVPAVERVLSEEAFWDVYYEHCSYFSLGSLTRVFRANRFDIVELRRDFDDQYLLVVARPTEDATDAAHAVEDDLMQIAAGVARFRDGVPKTIDRWRSRITDFNTKGKRVAVWGSGSKCVSFLCSMGTGVRIDAVVDVNPFRHGKWLAGIAKQVVAPETLRELAPDVIVAMNPIYCEEIRRNLDAMNVSAELMAV